MFGSRVQCCSLTQVGLSAGADRAGGDGVVPYVHLGLLCRAKTVCFLRALADAGPVFYFLSVLPACIAVIEVLFLSKPAKKSTIESVYAAPARP